MALAMLMVQKQELLTKTENENISRKQNYSKNPHIRNSLFRNRLASSLCNMKTRNFDKQAEKFLITPVKKYQFY